MSQKIPTKLMNVEDQTEKKLSHTVGLKIK